LSWVKLDDRIFLNPKFRAREATTNARMLYIAGLTFSAQAESDGAILASDMPLVLAYARISDSDAATRALVKLGLWQHTSDGYQIHDYLEYQFSREYLNGERERKRQVAATRRAAARSSTNQESSAASSGACSNVPSRPVPSGSGSSMGGSKLISLRSDQRARRLPAQPTPEEIEEISANAIGEEPEEEAGS
jgi:hypothetical protein